MGLLLRRILVQGGKGAALNSLLQNVLIAIDLATFCVSQEEDTMAPL